MDLADRTIDAARRLANDLRPGILDLGLQAAMEWQIQEFRYYADIRCELDLPPDEIPLKPNQEVALFRIFQETLTNVARHAGASLVTIKLTVENGRVTLAVQDNGRGITPERNCETELVGTAGHPGAGTFPGRYDGNSRGNRGGNAGPCDSVPL